MRPRPFRRQGPPNNLRSKVRKPQHLPHPISRSHVLAHARRSTPPPRPNPAATRARPGPSTARPTRATHSPRPARLAHALGEAPHALQRHRDEPRCRGHGAPPRPGRATQRAPDPPSLGPPWTGGPAPSCLGPHRPRGLDQCRSATWPVKPATHAGPGRFAKSPLWFSVINPRSTIVQKYFELGPDPCSLDPGAVSIYLFSPLCF